MKKFKIYEYAFLKYGFDSQVIKLGEECSELATAACQFINHRTNGKNLAEESADVEIMIEQMRHNGMAAAIDEEKGRKLGRLALMLEGAEDIDSPPDAQALRAQLNELDYFYHEDQDDLQLALLNFDYVRVASLARRTAGRLMHIAQISARLARIRAAETEGQE
ncbi:hypothetical protein [Rahnella contaminans]|uniref:hypothetical protein n=1 Tax=Rahnella contaminans TaxID=2703882 RepID=UPI003C2F0021